MNAYELAEDLENSNGLQYITKVGLVSLSSQMLRQQAEANTCTMAAQALHYIKQGLERKD